MQIIVIFSCVLSLELAEGGGELTSGSHSITFWTYAIMRAIHTVFLNSCFNLSVCHPCSLSYPLSPPCPPVFLGLPPTPHQDAAASTIAKREDASFSNILFFGNFY